METELAKEWETAKKLHIMTYMFLHNFYTNNQLYDAELYAKLKRYACVLQDMDKYDETVYITSTYNLGCLINLFDPSEKAKEFLNFIKSEMIRKMKRLKYLSKNLYPDRLVEVSDENAEIVNNIQSIFDQQWSTLCTSVVPKESKKKKKKVKNKPKKKPKKDDLKTEVEVEDYTVSDEETPTESVFANVDLNIDKERDITLIKSMNQSYRSIESKTSYSNVSKLLKKLNLTSSIQDHSLLEIVEEPDDLLLSYSELKEMIFYDQESVSYQVHFQEPYCIVGPFAVRRYEDELVFYCTIDQEDCKNWFTTKTNYLHRHIQALHSTVKMTWSCSLCPLIDTTFQTDLSDLETAFKHLIACHIENPSLLEKYQDRNHSYVPNSTHICVRTKKPPKLFNCPYPNCKFTSDNEIESYNHMYDIFSVYESYQCTYCEQKFNSSLAFIGHIKDDHKFDKFRCAYCMYRSISKNNVIYHQMDEHISNSVKVLESKLTFDPPKPEDLLIIAIHPYICMKRGCYFKTSIVKNFMDHLTSHKDDFYACQSRYCNYVSVPSSILEHLLDHGIGEYQCFVCPYATNNRQAIRRHMYSTHSSKLPLCIQRVAYEDSAKIAERYTSFLSHTVQNEDIVLLDLDSSVIEENIEHQVVDVKEYEKMVNVQSKIGLNLKDDEEETKIVDNIELSSSEDEEPQPSVSIIEPKVRAPQPSVSKSEPKVSKPTISNMVINLDSDEEIEGPNYKIIKTVPKIVPIKKAAKKPPPVVLFPQIETVRMVQSEPVMTKKRPKKSVTVAPAGFIKLVPKNPANTSPSTSSIRISPNMKVLKMTSVRIAEPKEDPLALDNVRQIAKKSTTKNGVL